MRTSRSGLTFVEIVVAVLVVSALFGIIWTFYSAGMTHMQATERTLESTRATHMLFELLHRDLKRAREVMIPADITKLSGVPFEKGDALIYVDLKEYCFRRKERTVYVGGAAFRLGRFEEVVFESKDPGMVTFRITPVPTAGAVPDLPMVIRAGRFTLESTVCVERVLLLSRTAGFVEEEKTGHGYCLAGWPLDY